MFSVNSIFVVIQKLFTTKNPGKKGQNKWLHPDIVGVYFPFDDFHNSTVSIIGTFSDSAIKLFSFEMKIKITLKD